MYRNQYRTIDEDLGNKETEEHKHKRKQSQNQNVEQNSDQPLVMKT